MSGVKYEGAIGIDFGTSYSRVAVWENGEVVAITDTHGNYLIPSCVSFGICGTYVGHDAMELALSNPQHALFCAKRLLGQNFGDPCVTAIDSKYFFRVVKEKSERLLVEVKNEKKKKLLAVEKIVAMILLELKELAEAYLGKTVTSAVLTVPATFGDAQRRALLDAASIAGLKVIHLLHEHTAASLAHRLGKVLCDGEEKNVCVVDVGSDRFTATLTTMDDGGVTVKQTSEYMYLKDVFMEGLFYHCLEEFECENRGVNLSQSPSGVYALRAACEVALHRLSVKNETEIQLDNLVDSVGLRVTLTRETLERMCEKFFEAIPRLVEQVLRQSKTDKSSVDDVVLCGGSAHIPKIQQMLSDFFERRVKLSNVHPDLAVVSGAAIKAFILTGGRSAKTDDMEASDVMPWALGIRNAKDASKAKIIFGVNTAIPACRRFLYSSIRGEGLGDKAVVLWGPDGLAQCFGEVGRVNLSKIPIKSEYASDIEIVFSIDASGLLTILAEERKSLRCISLVVCSPCSLSESEKKRLVKDAAKCEQEKLKDESIVLKKKQVRLQMQINKMPLSMTAE